LESNTGLAMGISFGGVVSGDSTDPIRGGTADYDCVYLYARGSDAQWLILTDNGSDPNRTHDGTGPPPGQNRANTVGRRVTRDRARRRKP